MIAANQDVAADVQLLALDPYEKGWLVRVKVTETPDTSSLMDIDAYEASVAEEEH